MVWTVLMRARKSGNWRRVAFVLLAAWSVAAAAQMQMPTQAQIDAFKALPPEQQQQILQQLGLGNGAPAAPPTAPTATTTAPTTLTTAPTAPLVSTTMPFGFPVEEEPRLRAGDSLLLDVTEKSEAPLTLLPPAPAPALVPGAAAEGTEVDRTFAEFQQGIRDGNPYRLDRTGRLLLPGQIAIALAGLTKDEAEARLNADPQLQSMTFEVTFLPVEPELKPFGYDLFTGANTSSGTTSTTTVLQTLMPATDIPVPAEYVIGPGDTIELQLVGDTPGWYQLVVGRDGQVNLPELGPVPVAGLTFEAAKAKIEQQVASKMIGTRAAVSVGALRSIQVFVLGEAVHPGSYTVSGLSTITNALFASGGVREIGSLRQLQLKRNGRLVTQLDLYDVLLHGDTSHDARLMSGDVIFIPPVGPTVAASGEVRRPAIYELRPGDTAAELLKLAGGLTPVADARVARIERVADQSERTAITLDLSTPQGLGAALVSGDVVQIDAIRDRLEGAVALMGYVQRAGRVQYRPGMRLTDLVRSLDELKPHADTHYVLVRRETGPTRVVSTVSADLAKAFEAPGSDANLALQPRDTVYVFDMATSRERVVQPLLMELDRQSAAGEPQQVVTVSGHVKVPGNYPLEPGMTVSDLLRAGGGLDQAAFVGQAELTRHHLTGGISGVARRQSVLLSVDLNAALAGSAEADLPLEPFDQLVVKEMPEWQEQETISILGEVRFPGQYPIRRGETLREVVKRAGGLTDLAFMQGSVFTREDLKEREQRQLELFAERLQRDLAALSLEQAQSGEGGTAQAISAGQQLLNDLQSTKPVGRLVINLDEILKAEPGAAADLIVRDGDALYIPRQAQEVTVLGEVQNSTSHLYRAELARDDYIKLSGGVTQRADPKRTFIVRADGSVAAGEAGRWFSRGAPKAVHQGDTIVVPIDAERVKPLSLWTSVTQILYNIAVAVAAVNSF
jgi:polysaccharide biosynthesis/export protein